MQFSLQTPVVQSQTVANLQVVSVGFDFLAKVLTITVNHLDANGIVLKTVSIPRPFAAFEVNWSGTLIGTVQGILQNIYGTPLTQTS